MTQQKLYHSAPEPLYGLVWRRCKNFPGKLAAGSQTPPTASGSAAAALVSAGFGCFFLMVNQHLTNLSKDWDNFVWALGSWIPGSHNPDELYGSLGSYSGKETLLLIGWLGSWLLLSRLWGHRQIKAKTIFFWLFTFFTTATIMAWHPLFPYLPLMPSP